MKILHIIYDDLKNPWCGGGGAYRASEVNEHISNNNQITVLTGNYPGAKNETINGVSYIRVGICKSYLISRISFALLVPLFIQRYETDIIINDCSFFAPCFADLFRKRVVVNIIHYLMDKHALVLYPIFGVVPFFSEKIFLNISKNVITPSIQMKNVILERFPNKNVVNIPNGVSHKLFQVEPKTNNYILSLGRIDIYGKGIDILIKSFSKIQNKNILLKIAGSGKQSDLNALMKLIKEMKLVKRVHVVGKVTGQEKLDLLGGCLFLVMSSRFEGWGIVGVEANATGKPVIGSKVIGLSEAVREDKTALLVKPGNVYELTSAMNYLIENKKKRKYLGNEGRAWAKQFSWSVIAREQFNFYQKIVDMNFSDKKY